MPSNYYCYDLENGWISFSQDAYDLIFPFNFADLKVVVKISGQRDLHLGTCGIGAEGTPQQYGSDDQLFTDVCGTNLYFPDPEDDQLDLDYVIPSPNENLYQHQYAASEQSFELDPQGAVGVQVGSLTMAENIGECYPDLDPWNVNVMWNSCEAPFQGHFFWNASDQVFAYAQNHQKRTTLFSFGTPAWSKGNFQYVLPSVNFKEWYNRVCDERLHGLFLSNVIKRYGKNTGLFLELTVPWNAAYLPEEICIENEPDCANTGYGHPYYLDEFADAVFDIAMKMLYNYQAVKTTDPNFTVICPNFYGPVYSGIATRSPAYFDYMISDPDDPRIQYQAEYGENIRLLYTERAIGFSNHDEFQALRKYTDWWDYQYQAGEDPVYIVLQPGYPKGPLAWQECWSKMYTEQDMYYLPANQYPNRRIVSMESTGNAQENASLNGSFFMKYPENTDYAEAYAPYFVNIASAPEEEYVNVNYRRSVIDPYPGCADNLAMQNTMAKLLKNTQALPILLEPGTYNPNGTTVQTPYQPGNSIFYHEGQANGPTVIQFGYKSISDPDNYYIVRHVRALDGISGETVQPIINVSENSSGVNSVYLYNDQASFFERDESSMFTAYNTETGLWETSLMLAENEVSISDIIIAPDENGAPGQIDQGVYFQYTGNGWNLLSFNVRPPDASYVFPYDYIFTCSSLFTEPFWENLTEIEDWDHDIYDPGVSDLNWNMEQGYKAQVGAPIDYLISNSDVFTPEFGINVNGLSWYPDPDNTGYYRFFLSYYPNVIMDAMDATVDMRDNSNLKAIKDDDGNAIIWREAQQTWASNLEVMTPGKGYRLLFSSATNREDQDEDGYFSYPEPPGGASIIPGGGKNFGSGSNIAGNYQSHFTYISHTPEFFPIIIDSIFIDSVEIAEGDQIGVFTPAGLCVGAEYFEGEIPIFLAAWMDDYTTEAIDGYQSGEPMTFKLWDASAGIEIEFTEGCYISAVEEDPDIPVHSGFGVGVAASRTLIAGNPVNILPQSYALGQNYPNPFNPTTTIPFSVPTESKVKIEIYNLLGQKVALLEDGLFQAGKYQAIWEGKNDAGGYVSSGIYFVKMEAEGTVLKGKFSGSEKLILMK